MEEPGSRCSEGLEEMWEELEASGDKITIIFLANTEEVSSLPGIYDD
jgi:hypothetical protein